MKRRKCRPSRHYDRRMRGGARVKCTACGDVFPCRTQPCEHFDCAMVIAGEIDPLTLERLRPIVRPVVSGEQLELVIVTGGDS